MIVWPVYVIDNSDSDLRYTAQLVEIYATEELAEKAVYILSTLDGSRFEYYYEEHHVLGENEEI